MSQEICAGTSNSLGNRLKHAGVQACGHAVFEHDGKSHEEDVTGYSDSGWSGCRTQGMSPSRGRASSASEVLVGMTRHRKSEEGLGTQDEKDP